MSYNKQHSGKAIHGPGLQGGPPAVVILALLHQARGHWPHQCLTCGASSTLCSSAQFSLLELVNCCPMEPSKAPPQITVAIVESEAYFPYSCSTFNPTLAVIIGHILTCLFLTGRGSRLTSLPAQIGHDSEYHPSMMHTTSGLTHLLYELSNSVFIARLP